VFFSLLGLHLSQEQIDLHAVYEREMAIKRAVMSRPGYCELCGKSYKDLGDVRATQSFKMLVFELELMTQHCLLHGELILSVLFSISFVFFSSTLLVKATLRARTTRPSLRALTPWRRGIKSCSSSRP
jgi:hypothetical protein